MPERIVRLVLTVCLIVAGALIVLWLVGLLGVTIPQNIITVLTIALILFVVLLCIQVFRGKWTL